ncbi:ARM repeat superfamily protein [Artemisia annua]|uniref:ARM repeat superfamily protein n=1 Tax=Artemisia annua TaxID=35608 RepID=A0A2U1M4W2_ARTAN|nr:ARM repeat superfamily protein [Artemisia annua]
MTDDDGKAAMDLIHDVGKQLTAKQKCPNKDFLVKLLKQAASALPKLKKQSDSLKPTIKPLSDSILKHGLLKQKDKDVRLLVAICVCEILRILAPEPGFSDEDFRDIFQLLLGMFAELADTKSPYYSRRVELLETIAKYNFCVRMLDIRGEDLVLKMFNIFFSVIRKEHSSSVFGAMSSIMSGIFQEKVSQALLEVVLRSLLKDKKDASPASFQLAVSVIDHCSQTLQPLVCRFLNRCILDRDSVNSELKESYHDIIYEIFQCAPQMLIAVVPNLTQELLTDQVDVRITAIKFVGKLFSIPGHHVAQEYHHLFIEFLNRFTDKSASVRLNAVVCARSFYVTNPLGEESTAVLSELEGRLLDFDDKVRIQAVAVMCDLAKSSIRPLPSEMITQAAKRLRDKKVSVRKKALQMLLDVYHHYCIRCSEGIIQLSVDFEHIPCGILMLCYDKDTDFGCKYVTLYNMLSLRPQNIEDVLEKDLFPVSLSVEERIRHWLFLFSNSVLDHKNGFFSSAHEKALTAVVSQKKRLQNEMQSYLDLRTDEKQNVSEKGEERVKKMFAKMSMCFPKSLKAEECFHRLHLVKDADLFNKLKEILSEVKLEKSQIIRDNFLKKIKDRYTDFEFLQSLVTRCSFNIFSSDHVSCIFDHLLDDNFGQANSKNACVRLLMIIVNAFPLLLKSSEEQFCTLLLQKETPFCNELLQMLVKAGRHISVDLSVIYPFLENICLNGTRTQAKLAISAISELIVTSKQFVYTDLCKTLVDALESGKNTPTVLQSLGCMAQHSVSAFESHAEEITRYIVDNIFLANEVDVVSSGSECTSSCKLKAYPCTLMIGMFVLFQIYGLKTLVKSFLPHQRTGVTREINEVLDIISQMLERGDISEGTLSGEIDKDHLRLSAATSVLKLSQIWDPHIPPDMYHKTVLMAKDNSSLVRRSFLMKTFKLLRNNVLHCKYLCAFALDGSDPLDDSQRDESLNYMAEVIRNRYIEEKASQTSSSKRDATDNPVSSVMFLIHILAHDTDFPADSGNEDTISSFSRPLIFTMQALLNPLYVDGDMNRVQTVVSELHSIFNAIKRAEDAHDVQMTSRLHVLADFGAKNLVETKSSDISASHGPTKILLPSSLYRKREPEQIEPVKKLTKKGVRKSLEDVLDTDGHVPKRCKSLNSHKGKPHETQKQTISAENENQDFISPESISCHDNALLFQMEDSSCGD